MDNDDKYYDDLVGQLGLFKKKQQPAAEQKTVSQPKPNPQPRTPFQPRTVTQPKPANQPKQTFRPVQVENHSFDDEAEIEALKDKVPSEGVRAAKCIIRSTKDADVVLSLMLNDHPTKHEDIDSLYHLIQLIDKKAETIGSDFKHKIFPYYAKLLEALGRSHDHFASFYFDYKSSFKQIRLIAEKYIEVHYI